MLDMELGSSEQRLFCDEVKSIFLCVKDRCSMIMIGFRKLEFFEVVYLYGFWNY